LHCSRAVQSSAADSAALAHSWLLVAAVVQCALQRGGSWRATSLRPTVTGPL
jgi:hypothetical protein